MKDRFTNATTELSEKNSYLCTGCEVTYGHPTFGHLDLEAAHERGHELATRGAECILNCDPMPFGD